MKKMTQKELVLAYVDEFGSILPAKGISGKIYKGIMFGSETKRRCQELRDDGVLDYKMEGRFIRFFRKKKDNGTLFG